MMPSVLRPSRQLVAAVAVTAAGVGLAGMVFALADPYVLRTLPYAFPDSLVSIQFGLPEPRSTSERVGIPALADWQARTDLFDGLAAFQDKGWIRVRTRGGLVPLRAVAATDNLLRVLGLDQRSYSEPDPVSAFVSARVVASSSAEEFSPGQSLALVPDGLIRIRGSLPSGFVLPEPNRSVPTDIVVSLTLGPVLDIRGKSALIPNLVGRLRSGVTPRVAEEALNASLATAGYRVTVLSLPAALTSRLRGLAVGGLLASALIVVVCWINVFNLALTRGLYRQREMATRTALGATPSHLVFLVLGDGLRMAVLATVSALTVALLTLTAARLALPSHLATLGVPSMTVRVMGFVLLACGSSGAAWTLASLFAWGLGARRPTRPTGSVDGKAIRVVRFALIAGQVAAASVLLTVGALLARSYLNLLGVDAGMDGRTQALTVSHRPDMAQALRRDTVERTLEALRRVSGVEAAGATDSAVLDGRQTSRLLVVDGRAAFIDWTNVAGDFFKASGLSFIAGGAPMPGDASAAVITERAAKEFFSQEAPIGAVLVSRTTLHVVGVVRDVRIRALDVAPRPGVYESAGGWLGTQPLTTYVMRTADGAASAGQWERAIYSVDPAAVILDSGAVRERLARSVRDRSFSTLVVSLFALAGVLVTALGVAGIVGYTVVRRTRELAIRLALGATHVRLRRLVVREALSAAACGALGGVVIAAWCSSALTSLLYGIEPADPASLIATVVLLCGVVLAATLLPAARVAKIAPAIALKTE